MLKILNKKKIILLTVLLLTLGVFAGCSSDDSGNNDIVVEPIGDLLVKVTVPSDTAIDNITVSLSNVKSEETINSQTKAVSNIDEDGVLSFPFSDLKGNEYDVLAKAKDLNDNILYVASTSILDSTKTTIDSVDFSKTEKIDDIDNLRIYQVMVESFQDGDSSADYGVGYGPSHHRGDLKGITDAIPYIKSIGANAIWLTPIFESKGTIDSKLNATGYYADNYFKVDSKFGTEDDLRDLIDTAHDYGMYVFLDGVFGHHGAVNETLTSPDGNTTTKLKEINSHLGTIGYETKFPESLDFFKEVATYWIEEYEIDGWRLDQAYQLYQDGTNYWYDIREAVEDVSQARKDRGEEWGTLGYLVGEIWDGSGNQIADEGYSQDGLKSAFDFPMRYSLVQVLATEEYTDNPWSYGESASKLNSYGFGTHSKYPADAHPNLMLTNHDLVRFGDLIQRAPNLGYGKENPDYWKRHKAAFSFLAAYTGPITLYYGDEIGREVEGFVNEGDSGYYDDHASRDSGKTFGFTAQEEDLKDYVSKLMNIRANHPALWNGERSNLVAENTKYADLKTDLDTGEEIVYVLNTGTSETTISVSNVGGTKLVDLLTGEEITGSGNYDIPVGGLTGRFLLVQ
ncbi:alpha-amylase family glycosyl hydrolase [Orenia marismortui]|uniref:Glycosidase n=1 Tax=Orenia marismortui TaxID=46469 RepID=A0A4R8H983_9FIRM|nr:alpha-amylase family glycosyl hydrolase [Orenia marismortui]TDX52516.1 glycosidase [Orenia marismortui]